MRLRMSEFLDPDRILDFYTPYHEDQPRGVLPPASSSAARANGRSTEDERSGPRSGAVHVATAAGPPTRPASEGPPRLASAPSAPAGFPFGPANGHPGSNSWVVSGKRSATGKPLLANDPHLGLTAPSVWYFVHLSWPGRDLVGATFPGMPIVVLGHNGRAAWGLTNTGADTQDLFIEKLDPNDPTRYLTPDGYRDFVVHREVIEVEGADDVVVHVRESRHGPILDDVSAGAALASPPGHVLALAWTTLRDDDLTVEAGLGFPEARTWGDSSRPCGTSIPPR